MTLLSTTPLMRPEDTVLQAEDQRLEEEQSTQQVLQWNTTSHHSHHHHHYHHHYHPSLPNWVSELRSEWGELLHVKEWVDQGGEEHNSSSGVGVESDDNNNNDNYRLKHGWCGKDLIHDRDSPVRIIEYYVKYGKGEGLPPNSTTMGGIDTTLTGIVHFTSRAESHQRFCHGGSMCSVMDDIIGWCGFVVTGSCRPWTGFTVQINTSLKKPIMVNSILVIQAKVVKLERRKVWVTAELWDPSFSDVKTNTAEQQGMNSSRNSIHAMGDGLVILNRGVLPSE